MLGGTLDVGIVVADAVVDVDSCDADVIGPSTEPGALGATLTGGVVNGDDTLGAVITDTIGVAASASGSMGCITPEGPCGVAATGSYGPA